LVVWEDDSSGESDIGGQMLTGDGLLLGDNIFVSSAGSAQSLPSIAASPTLFWVTWTDGRSGLNTDIYGTRVSSEGEVLEPEGIPVCTEKGDQAYSDVAWGVGLFMNVWTSYTGCSGGSLCGVVAGIRVGANGVLLDSGPMEIYPLEAGQEQPRVTWGGIDFLTVWQEYAPDTAEWNIVGALLETGGSVLGSVPLDISSATLDQLYPSVVYGSPRFMVVWDDRRCEETTTDCDDIYGARLLQSVPDTDGDGLGDDVDSDDDGTTLSYAITGTLVSEGSASILGTTLTFDPGSDFQDLALGETRDAETARISLEAAMTGHLLLTSLHANDAMASLQRLEMLGCPKELVGQSCCLTVRWPSHYATPGNMSDGAHTLTIYLSYELGIMCTYRTSWVTILGDGNVLGQWWKCGSSISMLFG
jgi:hypothetical protein